MSNFDFLQRTPGFNRLYKIAVSAENNISIKPAITVMACRKALEITVRWLYKVEELTLPETTTLIELLKHRDFRYLVGRKVCGELHRLRKEGNRAIHGSPDPKNIPDDVTVDDGVWALSRLYLFLNWVDGFYGSHIGGKGFFSSAIETADGKPVETSLFPSPDIEQKEQEEPIVISKPEDRKKQEKPILAVNAPAEEPSFWEQMSVVDNVKEAYEWVWNLFGSEASKDAESAAAVENPEENNSWWDPIQHGIEDAYDWVIEPLKRTVPTIISKSSDRKNKQKAMPPKNKRSSISPGKPKRTSSSSASRKSAKDNELLKSVQHGIEDAYDWMTRPLKRYSPARKASVKLYSPIKKKKLA